MPTFFKSIGGAGGIGRAVALPDPHAEGSVSLVNVNPTIAWLSQRSIITRLTVSMQGNFQFLHTMGNEVYVYVFGDRVGQVTISGLSMANSCDGDAEHGFEKIYRWYQQNRIANRKGPVAVTIGTSLTLPGFVVGLTGDAVDPLTRLMQYNLQLAVLPEKTRGGGVITGSSGSVASGGGDTGVLPVDNGGVTTPGSMYQPYYPPSAGNLPNTGGTTDDNGYPIVRTF